MFVEILFYPLYNIIGALFSQYDNHIMRSLYDWRCTPTGRHAGVGGNASLIDGLWLMSLQLTIHHWQRCDRNITPV